MATPYRIVVGFDFSETGRIALEEAVALGRRFPEPEIHVVCVIDSDSSELVPAEDRHASLVQISDHIRERLGAESSRYFLSGEAPALRAIGHVRVGPIAEELTNLALEIRADLVVVGTHGRRGMRRLLLGSVAERAVRLAPCPVMVVRPRDFHAMEGLPIVEPPCPECVKAREASGGATWWCEEHTPSADAPHRYSFSARLDQPPGVSPYRS